jgi:O-antigen/teichoic acid export membrane protein
MANRLSRIIDRWRFYQRSWSQLDSQARQSAQVELENLERRRNFASVALYACTLAALLICIVIATLFVEVLLGAHIRGLVSALFIFAMAALISGLSTFLGEVHLATRTMRISLHIHGVD